MKEGTVFELAVLLFVIVVPALAQSPARNFNTASPMPTMLQRQMLLLGGGARWAARNGTNALYVDWYENALAHPNEMTPYPILLLPRRGWISQTLEQQGFNVSYAADIPNDLSGYDIVVIDSYFAAEPSNEPTIRNYLSNGGGVVLMGGVPCYFSTYCKDFWPGGDLSLISEWFGASYFVNSGGYAHVTVDNPFGTSLQLGDSIFEPNDFENSNPYSHSAAGSMHDDTHILAEWDDDSVLAFTHRYGSGRLYYQAEPHHLDYVRVPFPIARFTWSPWLVLVGEPVTLDASSSVPGWNDTAEKPITEYQWDFGDSNVTITTEPIVLHTYSTPGLTNVTLSVFDREDSNSSHSETISVVMPAFVSISTRSPSTLPGYTVEIEGTLHDAYGDGLPNEPVIIYYTFPGVSTLFPITSSITDEKGHYYIQWIAPATGYFTIIAEWSGNEACLSARNSTTLSSLPYGNEYIFSIESNSTVSAFAFNSTSVELSFKVTGEPGTMGYVKVTIAKNLIENVTDIGVYLDGNQIEYKIGSADDSWLLTFDYAHSTHHVAIALNQSMVPEFTSTLIIVILMIGTAIGLLIYKKHQFKKDPPL